MADIDGEGFLDFFASPSLSHAGSHFNPTFTANGSFTSSQPPPPPDAGNDGDDDDDWGDFMGPASRPHHPAPNSTSLQFNLSPSNVFPSNPPPRSTSTAFDPFAFADRSSAGQAEPESNRIGSDSKGIVFEKPTGPLPLSLFGEEEEERGGSVVNLPVNGYNLYAQGPKIEHQSGRSNSDTNGMYSVSNGTNGVSDDEDDWEFHGAFSQDGVGERNGKEQGDSEVSGSNAGQDASKFFMSNFVSMNSPHQFADLFASQNGASNKNSEVNKLESMNSPHQFADLFASQNGASKKNSEVNKVESMNSPHQIADLFSSQNGVSNKNGEVNNLESMNSPHQFADLFASQNGVSNKNGEVNNLESTNSSNQFLDLFASQIEASNKNGEVSNLESTNSSHQFVDLFASQNGVGKKNNEVSVETDFEATSFFPDAFSAFPVANGMEIGNANVTYPTPENTNEDFDDFGEFVDAASEPGSKNQDHNTRSGSHRQPFPESIFSNSFVESNEHYQNVTDKPTFAPRNGSTIQGSEKSIQDIISHLYTQGQHVPSVDSNEKTAENGSCTIQKTLDSSDNNSWDLKDAVGVKVKSNDMVQKESVKLKDLQMFVDFFARLRDKLHFLASCLLENAENSEAQEAHTVLQDDMGSGTHLEKDMPISGCLSDFIEVLHGPTFQIIESEYLLSRRLPLAEKDWKMAVKLLKETRLIAKILGSGLGDDQSVYISTWSNIVNVCAQELRYGTLIWKQAVENNLQIQILSDHQGQCYIQALGEIYRVIQLLGLSAKVYKPWMLLNKGDQLNLFLVLEECSVLWTSSGLEEAFWNLLGSVDSVSGQSVEALLESIKHIQEIDVLAVQDCAFSQQRSVCQLTLLPEQTLPELKLGSWNELRCFLKVANCWANLISHEPPCLPHLRVG